MAAPVLPAGAVDLTAARAMCRADRARGRLVLAELASTVDNRTYKRDKDGKFGTGGGGGGTPEQMHDEATIHATFDFHDEKTGLTASVTGIYPSHSGRISVEIKITDRDGKKVGEAMRSIRDPESKEVAHLNFGIDAGYQGQGFAARYNQQVEQSYRDHGIERIAISAAGGNGAIGGYAWARSGYDFTAESRTVKAITIPHEHAAKYPPAIQAEIRKVAANPHATPLEYAMIGWKPGATTWPGKEIMLATSWDGVKRL